MDLFPSCLWSQGSETATRRTDMRNVGRWSPHESGIQFCGVSCHAQNTVSWVSSFSSFLTTAACLTTSSGLHVNKLMNFKWVMEDVRKRQTSSPLQLLHVSSSYFSSASVREMCLCFSAMCHRVQKLSCWSSERHEEGDTEEGRLTAMCSIERAYVTGFGRFLILNRFDAVAVEKDAWRVYFQILYPKMPVMLLLLLKAVTLETRRAGCHLFSYIHWPLAHPPFQSVLCLSLTLLPSRHERIERTHFSLASFADEKKRYAVRECYPLFLLISCPSEWHVVICVLPVIRDTHTST